ncbi:hypothetical protein EFL95_06895 [Nocardioides marmorisolisilvae]|uniref:Uncharacterized protein n=1 Tax=Nocardioides marmorisolisilvae TaxID=1542737 RepID=A0A3N0DT79_9ACTN|nr:hypothetical protein EFL95_06895 [Nocardioides marmorisolisilvae]
MLVSETHAAEPGPARRAFWLLLVPMASALVPWLVLGAADARPGGLAILLVAAAPLIGALLAIRYAFGALVHSWLLAPYVAAAAVFMFVILAAGDITSGSRLDFGPATVTGVIMVVLAGVGGVVSYVWAPEPEEESDWEAERDARRAAERNAETEA